MVRKLHAAASEDLDARVHQRIAEALAENESGQAAAGRPQIWRIVMENKMVKTAAAAVIVVGAFLGISRLTGSNAKFVAGAEYTGPATCRLADGSSVDLAEGAKIKFYDSKDQRGFNHLTGYIVVDVEKGNGEFVVTTPYGEATALGTAFEMHLIDEVAGNTNERIEMLALKVTEGTVAVSNEHGKVLVEESQEVTMARNSAPYSATQDDAIPARVRERIAAMKKAFAKGDPAAWMANFNLKAVLDLTQGRIADPLTHPWFSQMDPGDVENLKKGMAGVAGLEELQQRMLGGVNIKEPVDVLVRSAKVRDDGKVVEAVCITGRDGRRIQTSPRWTFFDGDWWQTDD
ncbi:MAG: FecR domain-containing protein [Phycisphaerae bacterium]|nr:FecR domain-containing protein [Phycisphaerae bacterium]